MDLKLRSDVMQAKDSNIIYLARNLVCTGSNYFDTGFAPFYGDTANSNFKITIRIGSAGTNANQSVVIGCKYEATLSGQQWPGFIVRFKTSTNTFDIGGYNYWAPKTSSIIGKNLYIWRTGGKWYGQVEGEETIHTLAVRVAPFDQNIVIGAGEQTNHTKFRYSICNIDYVRIEYI